MNEPEPSEEDGVEARKEFLARCVLAVHIGLGALWTLEALDLSDSYDE